MYACAPQGRINGIITLRLGQALDIYTDGLTMTTEFKTEEYYGFQPVLFPPLVRQILAFYLDKVRPVVEAMQPELMLPDSPLFPSRRSPGNKADIASHMQAFYMRRGGIQITSTILRSIMSTECFDLHLDGRITDRGRGNILFRTKRNALICCLCREREQDQWSFGRNCKTTLSN